MKTNVIGTRNNTNKESLLEGGLFTVLYAETSVGRNLPSDVYAGHIVRDAYGRKYEFELVGPVCGNTRVVCVSTNHRYYIMDWELDSDTNFWHSADSRGSYSQALDVFKQHVQDMECQWGAHDEEQQVTPAEKARAEVVRSHQALRVKLQHTLANNCFTDEQLGILNELVCQFCKANDNLHI